ncbi:MAG TPA: Mur ligase family protein [Methanobacteriaceae archaeon]|nr:Mur ligase family protein [Methanobacteriaceae archaeon]
MSCLVIGAGNAGRPAARVLNHVGRDVTITDAKKLEEFPGPVQKTLLKMEQEGVKLHLGKDTPEQIEDIAEAYISPNIPLDAPIRDIIPTFNIKNITSREISKIINELMDIDIIGITGTLGKTSTTHLVSEIFTKSGWDVWTCSSLHGNLLSEIIVEGIVQGLPLEKDVAILELPHGTSRFMSEVKLEVGLLTNIYPEHLAEFDGSMEKYIERKMLITCSSQVFITSQQCKEMVESKRNDGFYFCFEEPPQGCHFFGKYVEDKLKVKYHFNDRKGSFETAFHVPGYYRLNAVAAAAVTLIYGLEEEEVKDALSKFKGIKAHMEYLGSFRGREVYFDAAYLPEGMKPTLDCFKGDNLVIIIDNPDSSTPRDKYRIGEVLGKYSKTIISSGFNETMKYLNMEAAQEVLNGAKNSNALKIAVEDIETAGELSVKHSKPGDTILHVGPGAVSAYYELKASMIRGIKRGCSKYG